jgi:hypothetical protein
MFYVVIRVVHQALSFVPSVCLLANGAHGEGIPMDILIAVDLAHHGEEEIVFVPLRKSLAPYSHIDSDQ